MLKERSCFLFGLHDFGVPKEGLNQSRDLGIHGSLIVPHVFLCHSGSGSCHVSC